MTIKEERDENAYDQGCDFQGELVAPNLGPASFQEFLHTHHDIQDRETHNTLHKVLVNHI
jgi:hypothetical protein